ncbi:2-dehydropantoate 2-reductase [uncultured Shimia sp.]|uniref:2-dehydropantoate 2-reductase n=1 Tax=uncultured Shimia sp. TaxID=573152 RepID=UPI0026300668|nr:2-dehydropantoate 2-reductase [uncultured Shimia sp.]
MNDAPMNKHGGPQIVVAGAGSVGCFVGGLLARGAYDVTLLLRPALAETLLRQGLTLTSFTGMDEELSPDMFGIQTDPSCLAKADIILVTVKSGSTEEMGRLIAQYASEDAVIVSLQNGVGNAGILKDMLPERDVRAGMVSFNVVNLGGGRFHRGTSGDILIQKGPGHVARTLSVMDLTFHERKSMIQIQWGKLLINLNNALNALSGLTLREQLDSMPWRRLMSDQMAEALRVLEKAGIETAPPLGTPIPMRFIPKILRLPSPLFRRIARSMLTIDPQARSSMWEDLEQGRPTEIEELQGMIVELARENGMTAPLNQNAAELIREAERRGDGPPGLSAHEIRHHR